MKAIVQDHFGGPESLQLQEVELPDPDSTSVRVRVSAASVNALDWRIMRGRPFVGRLMGIGWLRPKQRVRGVDVAGRVELVRKKDSRFHVGEEVFGSGNGSFAEFVAADERELEHKPESLPYPEAATLGVAAVTALQGLRDYGEVRPGQSVLITGAASGVGTFAVQIAKWLGARVTAVTSSANVELARSLGADQVLDYSREDFTRSEAQYDLILDISPRGSLRAYRRRLRPGGRIVVIGVRGGVARIVVAGLLRRLFRYPVKSVFGKVRPDDLRQLKDLVLSGQLRPVIDRTYPLREVPQAMAYVEKHQVRGKVVIQVD